MPPGSPAGTRSSAGEVVARWTVSGMVSGLAIGGGYGTLAGLVVGGPIGLGLGLLIGAVTGLCAGLAVGLLDGLLLAWLRPAPGYAPLAAAVCTELILLPVQVWLWLVFHPVAYLYLPAVGGPSAVSLGVAAQLGRRLPPGAGTGSPNTRSGPDAADSPTEGNP